MKSIIKFYGLAVTLILFSSPTIGSHIKGGVIYVCKLDTRLYEFSFTGFRDAGASLFGGGTFDFGDGSSDGNTEREVTVLKTVSGIDLVEVKVVHEYAVEGAYTVSYSESSGTDTQNMTGAGSSPFYVETSFESWIFSNCTPRIPLENLIPVFWTGRLEMRDLLGVDSDGDKVRYGLTKPWKALGQKVSNYQYPHHKVFYSNYENGNYTGDGRPHLSINRNTGTLVWNAPGDFFLEEGGYCPSRDANNCGEYTIALEITEYREINGKEMNISRAVAEINIMVADGPEDKLVAITEDDNFCTGEDGFLSFEVKSEKPYTLHIEPDTVVLSFNELPVHRMLDSVFTMNSLFEVSFKSLEEEQFVSFLLEADEEEENNSSSFTYIVSGQCDQYVLDVGMGNNEQLVLYPNPTHDKIWIQHVKEDLKFTITSLDGKTVKQGFLDGHISQHEISLAGIERGIYAVRFYAVNSKNKMWQPFMSKKVIVRK